MSAQPSHGGYSASSYLEWEEEPALSHCVWEGGHGFSGKHIVCFFHRNSFTVVLHIRYLTEQTNVTCLRTKLP